MSLSMNKVILIGNLGRSVEVRYFGEGKPVANLSLATSVSRKDKNTGQWRDETQWHDVVLYGAQAEWAGEKLTKGRTVHVEGSIRYGSFQNKDGQRVPTVQIVASHIEPFGIPKKSTPAAEGQASEPEAPEPSGTSSGDPWIDAFVDGDPALSGRG